MTTINPVTTTQQTTAFKGKERIAKKLAERKFLDANERIVKEMEYKKAFERSPEEFKEMIIKDTISESFKSLAENAAKQIYKK